MTADGKSLSGLKWAVVLLVVLFGFGFVIYGGVRVTGAQALAEVEERAARLGISLKGQRAEIDPGSALAMDEDFGPEWRGEREPKLQKWGRMEPSPFLKFLKQEGMAGEDEITSSMRMPSAQRGRTVEFQKLFGKKLTEEEAQEAVGVAGAGVLERTQELAGALLRHPVPDMQKTEDLDPIKVMRAQRLSGAMICAGVWNLREGKREEARELVLALGKLPEVNGSKTLVGYLIELAIRAQAVGLIWEGLRLQKWTAEDLVVFQEMLEAWEPRTRAREAVAGELAFSWTAYEQIVQVGVTGEHEPIGGFSAWESLLCRARLTDGKQAAFMNQWMDAYEIEPWSVEVMSGWLRVDEEKKESSPGASASGGTAEALLQPLAKQTLRSEVNKQTALVALYAEKKFLETGVYPRSWKEVPEELWVWDELDAKRRLLSYEIDGEGRPFLFSLREKEAGFKAYEEMLSWRYSETKK